MAEYTKSYRPKAKQLFSSLAPSTARQSYDTPYNNFKRRPKPV